MDVRSIEEVPPVVEHNGTVPVWWLVNPREMKEITDGGFLELVSEFEVEPEECLRHTREHLAELVAHQLVITTPAAGP